MSTLDEITKEKQRLGEALARVDAQRDKLTSQLTELEATERVLALFSRLFTAVTSFRITKPNPLRSIERSGSLKNLEFLNRQVGRVTRSKNREIGFPENARTLRRNPQGPIGRSRRCRRVLRCPGVSDSSLGARHSSGAS